MDIKFEYPEGATPIDDISGLKISWVKTQKNLNRVEGENIAKATYKYLMKNVSIPQLWFKVTELKKIHKEMFFDVWDWAGNFRTIQTNLGVKPYMINNLLNELCLDVLYWCEDRCELTFIEQAARIHYKLVSIHPFQNGNGRFARLVADRYLKAWKCQFPIWPIELQNDVNLREQYISSLKSADKGDYDALIHFMKTCGAKEPNLSEVLENAFYKKYFKNQRLISIIKAYFNQGYNINTDVNSRCYPLHIAIEQGLYEVVRLLILSEADIHFRDKSGYNSFEIAIIKNKFKIAKMLCDYGYPYKPGQLVSGKLLQYYNTFRKFDKQFFKTADY